MLLASGAGLAAETDLSDRFYQAIRNNDLSSLRALVKNGDVNVKDQRGGTPLMYTAAFGNPEQMNLLLNAAAEVNAKNAFNATALIWAAGDPMKSRMLIEQGADVNVKSQQGRTPLMVAAGRDGAVELVRLLLAKGADMRASGNASLLLASQIGDLETMRLLIEKGADVNTVGGTSGSETPLLVAVATNDVAVVKLLLAKGANVNEAPNPGLKAVRSGLNVDVPLGKMTPLMWAAPYGSPQMISTLLKAGANVNARDVREMTALMLAVAAEAQDVEVVKLLLRAGAEVNVRSTAGETALDWAKKFGNRAVLAALEEAGAKEGLPYSPPRRPDRAAPPDAAKAVEKSVALLQRSSAEFFKQSGCVGCHHQDMTAMAVRAARSAGIPVNEAAALEQVNVMKAMQAPAREVLLQGVFSQTAFIPASHLQALWAAGYRPDMVTDSMVAAVASSQLSDGRWQRGNGLVRSPMAEGPISWTAEAVLALQYYPIPGREAEFQGRIASARAWLLAAQPRFTDEHALLLLALTAAGADKQEVRKIADSLIAQQRTDGGWAGNRNLASDAFSTGEALYALRETGLVTVGDKVHRRGVQYLLNTQYPDGSWFVRSRAVKMQPYFQSGFPFDHDQWISAAATAWASVALAAQVKQDRRVALQ